MAEAKKAAVEETATTKKEDDGMVEIELFKDNGKYKEDLFVGVNGKFWLVKRGEKVKVPAEVAEVIENSFIQQKLTNQLIAGFTEDYKKKR